MTTSRTPMFSTHPTRPWPRGVSALAPLALAGLLALAGCDAAEPPEVRAPEELPEHRPPDGLLDAPGLQALVEAQNARDTAALVEALNRADAAERARAAFGLGSLRAPAAAPALVELLDDPDARVRADAVFALGQLPPEAVTPPEVGDDGGEAAPQGVDGSASDESPSPALGIDRELLARLESESDATVRALLIEALGRVGGPEVAAVLVERVPAAEEHAVLNLALARLALRGVGGVEIWNRLAGDLTHPDPEVRAFAAYPFGRSDEVPEYMRFRRDLRIALAQLSYDDFGAWHLLRGMSRGPDLFSLPLVDLWLREAEDWRARAAAAAALTERKSEESWDLLVAALDDPVVHVRDAAAEAMTTTPWGPEITAAALQHVRERPDDHGVNARILEHLAAMGETEPVLEWMEGRDWDDVRGARTAVRVAAATPGEEAVRWLWEASTAPHRGVRSSALGALTERWEVSRTHPEARPVFLEGFERVLRGPDDSGAARAAALMTDTLLAPLGGEARVRAYYAELDPTEDASRMAALLRALGETADTESEALLRRESGSAVPGIARAAALALSERTGEEIDIPDEVEATPVPRPSPDWERLRALGANPRLVLETERGRVVLELATEEAPLTVQEITRLAEAGRYDGVPFHRVVRNFVVQGGDVSLGVGGEGPDVRLRSELTRIPYERGVLGMARTARFDTEGSQFFVTHSVQPHLTGLYGAFGWVVEGMNVIDRIAQDDLLLRATVEPDPSGGS